MASNKGLVRLNKLHRTRENRKAFTSYSLRMMKTNHCLDLTDVVRVADENIPKYRQVNYEAMREAIHERKRIGSQALQRGRSLLCFTVILTRRF